MKIVHLIAEKLAVSTPNKCESFRLWFAINQKKIKFQRIGNNHLLLYLYRP